MNLRQMEAFRAVIMTGSVTQAAKQLFKTQPAISMLIKTLEDDLGFLLFERQNKRLLATPEANYLYDEVEAIFSRLDDINQTISDIQNKQYGFLRVGCMPGPATFFMPDVLADFLDEHPRVRASLQTRTSDEISKWVVANQYDIGLADVTGRQQEIVNGKIYNLPCYCAIPADNPIAKYDNITPEILDNEPMITLLPDHMTYHELIQIFEASGCRMNVRLQTRYFTPALRFIERGLGVCIMDPISLYSYCQYAQPGKIVFRRFTPSVAFKFGVIYPSDTPKSTITRAFAKKLHDRIDLLESGPEEILSWGK